jgi:predicted molibdopterin-dependent oxidoreductase YjgC
VLPTHRRGNVVGALQVGMTPGEGGNFATGMLQAAADGRLQCLVLVGCDPLSDFPDHDLAQRALATVPALIAVDTVLSPSAQQAHVVLPAAAYGEKAGTVTNIEGRVQTVAQQVNAPGTARPDWMIAVELATRLGHDLGLRSVDEVTDAIARSVPAYAGITAAAVRDARDGLLAVPAPRRALTPSGQVAPQPSGYDFRLIVGRELYDLGIGTALSPSLAGLPRGARAHLHPLDLERMAPGGQVDQVRVSSAKGSLVVPAVADPGLQRGLVWMPFNQPGGAVSELLDAASPVLDVRVEVVG